MKALITTVLALGLAATASAQDMAMTHMAIQEAADGKNAKWLDKVGDEQYGK